MWEKRHPLLLTQLTSKFTKHSLSLKHLTEEVLYWAKHDTLFHEGSDNTFFFLIPPLACITQLFPQMGGTLPLLKTSCCKATEYSTPNSKMIDIF
jgi:hypothetical protein